MRIGIVTQSYFPIRGGVAEHVFHTALELERRGHEVTIITANFSRFDDDRGRQVIRLGRDFTIPYNGAFINLTVGWSFRERLRAIERERRFEVVHVHGPLEPVLPLFALQSFRAPIVGTFHSYSPGTPTGYVAFQKTLRGFASHLQARIAVSEAAKSFISRFFPGDYEIIPNGVDTERFHPEIEPMPWRKIHPEFTVLFVGRLDPRKGLKYLLQAFSIIARQVPNARLIVVGNGLLRPYYERFVAPELRHRVSFPGFVSAGNLPRFFASADVYVSPAIGSESFGIVLLEGLATGRPVVASDIIGYRDVVRNGVDGMLVEPKNPLAIAKAVIDLAEQPELRQRFSEAGRKRALEFSWPTVTERIEAVYQRVVRN
jgi:phosphatidylinositol alpha-mannosyltransferase